MTERELIAEAIGGCIVNLAVMGSGKVPDDWCQQAADAVVAALWAAEGETPDQWARLAALKPGWDSYGAPAISQQAIDRARNWLASVAIVPTSHGGVQLEWHRDYFDLEVEFDAEGKAKVYVEGAAAGGGTTGGRAELAAREKLFVASRVGTHREFLAELDAYGDIIFRLGRAARPVRPEGERGTADGAAARIREAMQHETNRARWYAMDHAAKVAVGLHPTSPADRREAADHAIGCDCPECPEGEHRCGKCGGPMTAEGAWYVCHACRPPASGVPAGAGEPPLPESDDVCGFCQGHGPLLIRCRPNLPEPTT